LMSADNHRITMIDLTTWKVRWRWRIRKLIVEPVRESPQFLLNGKRCNDEMQQHSTSSLGRRHNAHHHQRLETSKSSSAAPTTTTSITSSATPVSRTRIHTWPLKLHPGEENKVKLRGIYFFLNSIAFYIE